MTSIPILATAILLLTGATAWSADDAGLAQPLRVQTGLLAGAANADGTVLAFKGIPYAAPPVADLRWREPQPPVAWEGVRQAGTVGACCSQPVNAKQPLDCPQMVTLRASPPKAAMFCCTQRRAAIRSSMP